MITWKEANVEARAVRPDLDEDKAKIIARQIFIAENLLNSGMIVITFSIAALVVSLIALLK